MDEEQYKEIISRYKYHHDNLQEGYQKLKLEIEDQKAIVKTQYTKIGDLKHKIWGMKQWIKNLLAEQDKKDEIRLKTHEIGADAIHLLAEFRKMVESRTHIEQIELIEGVVEAMQDIVCPCYEALEKHLYKREKPVKGSMVYLLDIEE